jgi:hypothetical protein
MKRKEILLLPLREVRNEFADALVDLTQEQLVARPLPAQNPIGWITCHCLHNLNFFLYQRQTGQTLLARDEQPGALGDQAHFPTQNLFKKANEEGGVLWMPERAQVLAMRAKAKQR